MNIIIDITEGKKLVPYIVLVSKRGNSSLNIQRIAQIISLFKLNCEIFAVNPDVTLRTLRLQILFY
ncbi:acyltransferase [Bacillus thuringiensis]|uniref:Acyltransferase n=1 Tax=Bacillus thuringiensis TaxID=1428 RepID=A0AB36TN80_BACTU|nr:acyltransferase [Bacillus thuringiensis]PEE85356.1 acyltransferase [Bacillus thuringiensis]PFM85508.1 acyltransferase [Bacillus thuringiensis]